MKVTYTGVHHDLPAKLQEKLDKKFQKLAKLLDNGKGECKAHVILKQQRKIYKAEITVNFHHHQMVGIGSDADIFTAMSAAVAKLEAQAVKQKSKFREKTRRKEAPKRVAKETPVAKEAPVERGPRVIRVRIPAKRKPLSLEEAVMEMERDIDYVLYRDVESDSLCVLIRRRDGNLDLIEAS